MSRFKEIAAVCGGRGSGWVVMSVEGGGWDWSAFGPLGNKFGRHFGSQMEAERIGQDAERLLTTGRSRDL